jgi:hypothetical protein
MSFQQFSSSYLLGLEINHELEALPFSDLKNGGQVQPETNSKIIRKAPAARR